MLKHKRKLHATFATVTLLGLPSAHATYPTLDSMLEAIRPDAAVIAPELNEVILQLDAAPTDQDKFDALQTLSPLVDGALRAASEGPMRQMTDVISDRVRRVAQQSGYASGDEIATPATKAAKETEKKTKEAEKAPKTEHAAKKEVAKEETAKDNAPKEILHGTWIQVLGDAITQKTRQDIPGYHSDVYGIIIGRDRIITPQFLLGVAAGYVNADVHSRGPAGSGMDIKRLHGSFYGRYDFANCLYLQGVFTIANNEYDANRKILVPPFAGTPFVGIAHREFQAWEADGDLQAGLVWKKNHFQAVPKLILTYSHLDPESYLEEDMGGLNLNVKYQDLDFLTGGAGVKFEYQNEFEQAYVVPEIHGYAFYDFLADKQIATANFVDGGYAFLTQGATPARTSVEVGAGIEVHSYNHTAFIIRYDFAARDDYHRHAGFIKIRHEWG